MLFVKPCIELHRLSRLVCVTVPPRPVPNAANPSAVMVTSFKFAVREPCKMIASRGDVVGVDERRGVIFGLRVFVFKDL